MKKLSPENQFAASTDNVRAILARYNLPLTRFEYAASGIENVTLIIWSDQDKYVLRVYPQHKKSDADILLELDFMSYLLTNGLPLPAILSTLDGQHLLIFEFANARWQCVLMEHAQGAQPQGYTPALLDDMAVWQARMHNVGQEYVKTHPVPCDRSTLRATDVAGELLRNTAPDGYLRGFLERVNAFRIDFNDSLPKGLSHFDFDIDNLLTSHDQLTAILDFGDTECMPLAVCLGYTLWDVLFEDGGSADIASRYVQKYEESRPLTQSEKAILPQIILFRHYIITTFQMHLGVFSRDDFDKAVQQERFLRNLRF